MGKVIHKMFVDFLRLKHLNYFHIWPFQLKDIATENFQRICQAYEILSDTNKRLIYDIYGMEGLTSGLELGERLDKVEEIKEELERIRRQKEWEKLPSYILPSGSVMANLSVPRFLDGDGIMKGYSTSPFSFYASRFFLFNC